MLRRIKKPLLEQYHVRLWACTGITEHGILGWAVCYRKWNTFFMWADSHIEIVNGYKYLGVYLDKHLNFNEHCDNIYNSAGRALGKIMLKFAYFRNVGYKTFQKIFESYIESILTYSVSTITSKKYDFDRIQSQAARYCGIPDPPCLSNFVLVLNSFLSWIRITKCLKIFIKSRFCFFIPVIETIWILI